MRFRNIFISSNSPSLGMLITNETAVNLCQQYQLHNLSNRILSNPSLYRSWIFDGVSGIPDKLLKYIGDQQMITYQCSLPHDLAYAYGSLGSDSHLERKLADQKLQRDLVVYGGVAKPISYLFYGAVRLLGSKYLGLSFTWGYANRGRLINLNNTPIYLGRCAAP